MKKTFKNIGIIGRHHILGVAETLAALIDYLKAKDVKVITEPETAKLIPKKKIPIIPRAQFPEHCELIIVVGGDGSMLNVAPFAAAHNLPVLGINRGRLGFLADINPDKIKKIGAILQGAYHEEQRFLLEVSVSSEDKMLATDKVLNDIVLSAGTTTRLVEFCISIDEDSVCDYRADGLIIATPTGSTAYALSGGGPIIHPHLEALVLVPMFPHNLSSRPVVVSGASTINIMVAECNAYPLAISCDGRERISVPIAGKITIRRAEEKLHLIHPLDYNYFATLRSKLHWEQ